MNSDLAIIGGGGAGFAAAAKANELGIRAVLLNHGLPIGGTCVNVGCVPSKFLLEAGFDFQRSRHPRFRALTPGQLTLDFQSVIQEKEDVVRRNRQSKYQDVLSHYKSVQYIEERAHFESPGVIRAGSRLIEVENTIICTGASNRPFKLPGLETLSPGDVLDNISAFDLQKLPSSMIVIGGGPTGLEVAQIFSNFGTQVTLVETRERVLPAAEPEVSLAVESILKSEGIKLYTGTRATHARKAGQQTMLTVETKSQAVELQAEKLFVAIGLVGNTSDLNLPAIGLTADRNGFIEVDERMRTKVPGVFAAGDVAGPPWLETVAAREGAIAVESAFGGGKMQINYDSVPFAVFTEPQIAMVGVTEDELMRRIGICDCRTVDLRFLPKADITNRTAGVSKMVIDPRSKKIVGYHLVAPGAADIIHEAALAVQMELTVDQMIDLVHVFPTYSEIIKITAQAFYRDVTKMSCCVE